MTPGAIVFLSLGTSFAAAILAMLWWLSLPPRCPRCGSRDWVPAPHVGRFWAYCRKCTKFIDLAG